MHLTRADTEMGKNDAQPENRCALGLLAFDEFRITLKSKKVKHNSKIRQVDWRKQKLVDEKSALS